MNTHLKKMFLFSILFLFNTGNVFAQTDFSSFKGEDCWFPLSPMDENWEKENADIIVRTANVYGPHACFKERLQKIAPIIHSSYSDKLGLLGVQEIFKLKGGNDNSGARYFCSELNKYYKTDIKWDGTQSTNAIFHDSEWERVSRDYKTLGRVGSGRYVLENVLRHKEKKWILRFYTAHISWKDEKTARQTKDLANWIKGRAQKGELLPIVTGDFNAEKNLKTNKTEQAVIEMEKFFYRPMDRAWYEQQINSFAGTGIDIVYIGKKESFPDSYGDYLPIATHNLVFKEQSGEFKPCSKTNILTDHPFRAVSLKVLGSQPRVGISSSQLVSWGKGHLAYFTKNKNNSLSLLTYDENSGGWQDWKNLGGYLISNPEAISWGHGRLDVFAKGKDNKLLHIWYDKKVGKWSSWEIIKGNLYNPPKITSWGAGRLDIFAKGNDNHLKHLWYDLYRGGWGKWEDLGGNLATNPDVASWGQGRLDIVAIDNSSKLTHLSYDKSRKKQWGNWQHLAGEHLKITPKIISWGYGRLDIFTHISSGLNHLWYNHYDKGFGGNEKLFGEVSLKEPSIVSWGDGRFDIFAHGKNGKLKHLWYDYNGGWGRWEDLGGKFNTIPQVVTWGMNRLDIFTQFPIKKDNSHLSFDNGWGSWENKSKKSIKDVQDIDKIEKVEGVINKEILHQRK